MAKTAKTKKRESEKIVKGLRKIIKKGGFKFELTPAEKEAFERMRFEEEMNRKYSPNFRTCPGGCPGLHKQY